MTNEFEALFQVVKHRQESPAEGSYTSYLFDQGIEKILKKVGEESSEVIIAAMKNHREEIIAETSDLLYHLFVMLAERGISFEEVTAEIENRSHKVGNLKQERPDITDY
ncbi:phosphoribosyl-ATP diphosphatase [Vagococcus elongatus]|uniref:Phosphoribosyl-ATP pyrophosphatase n=1 Tax=Vagococcus elongatus TaxID=180344 RepID=A0A430AME7_9ENTE|nr:phosphoribosyl-ATP diphosphatase [Vagococcus elongatus]RSU09077.1 phosphoribosyl-ATP diphosphatase [Vagococcus elongatus]